jgi:hypothetical protein
MMTYMMCIRLCLKIECEILHSFHQGLVELEHINRPYMVFLPKKQGVVAVDAFRPICFQNCSVKSIAKIMT